MFIGTCSVTSCSPEDYYSKQFQNLINVECLFSTNQLIYKLIHNELYGTNEQFFLNEEDWLLCGNRQSIDSCGFLVVFQNLVEVYS